MREEYIYRGSTLHKKKSAYIGGSTLHDIYRGSILHEKSTYIGGSTLHEKSA